MPEADHKGAIVVLQESGQLIRIDKRGDVWMWSERLSGRVNIEGIECAPDAGQIALQAILGSIDDKTLCAAVRAAVMRLNGDVASVSHTGETTASERLADICQRLGQKHYATAIDLVIHKRAIARFTSLNDQAPANTICTLRQVLVDLTFAYGLMPASALRQLG